MDEEDIEDVDEDYILASRLEAGLFTLQQSALIMANLWFYNDVNLRKRILLLLHQQARFTLSASVCGSSIGPALAISAPAAAPAAFTMSNVAS